MAFGLNKLLWGREAIAGSSSRGVNIRREEDFAN